MADEIGEGWDVERVWTQHRACSPTLNWPASSLVSGLNPGMTVLGRKSCALMLPHKAPSVAMDTGSGLSLRADMPSWLRCTLHAA